MPQPTQTRDFGWQGIRLRVPEDWELGRVDGDVTSGYARLDDAEMVRAEIEWRDAPGRGARRPVSDLVDSYVANLEKKAAKTGVDFRVERQAKFLQDKAWLEGSEFEAFIWEADYRAYNVARACPDCRRVVLIRVLGHPDEDARALVNRVLPSLEDHPRAAAAGRTFWSVYGLRFHMHPDFTLTESDLKSGHIKLTFEADRGARTIRVHRLSMAQMLLRSLALRDWYPDFFHKDLRDVRCDLAAQPWRGHEGVRVTGRPRSRWRQVLKPLPMINPRPRRYLEGGAWHCPEQNRICVVEHLAKRREDVGGGVLEELIDGYVCHTQETPPHPRGDAELAPGAQRGPDLG